MESSSTPPSAASFPPMPPITSFSSCFLVLESLRSTTEKIQRSLLAHYGDLCRGCEGKSLSAEDAKKADDDKSKVLRDESVVAGTSHGIDSKDIKLGGDVDVKKIDVEMKGSDDDDGGLTVEDDIVLLPFLSTPPKNVKKEATSGVKSSKLSEKGIAREKHVKSSSSHSESVKRKREEEIDWIKKKLKRIESFRAEREEGEGITVEDDDDRDQAVEQPLPSIPDCIKELRMSEPKLRNYTQITQVLHKELGDVDYEKVVNRFVQEFEKEKEKEEQNARVRSNGESEEELIAVCKFNLQCAMAKTCLRRHPTTLAEPDKILLQRLEDQAGRKLIPRWLTVKDKFIRSLGQSLRERKEKMGESDFHRAMRIAEAYYKFEGSRKTTKRCHSGSQCAVLFCSGCHPNRTSPVFAKDFVLWLLDKYVAGHYPEELFPPFETIFPSYISPERHINYVMCLLRYRRDLGQVAFDRVLRMMEVEIPKEKKKSNKQKCTNTFALCKFRSSCRFTHNDIHNDMKILCDSLKEAKCYGEADPR